MKSDPSMRWGRAFFDDLWPLLIVNLVLWGLLPGLVFGNLHTDTLEAAYWARQFALGYSKHPPLTSWVIDAALWTGRWSILGILLASQFLSFLSAFFVWQLVADRASRATAALTATLLLLSPIATFYAIQINHNSVLIPFCAATLLFGLRLLEKGHFRDALGLGLAVGFGAITKYEIIFAVFPLLILSITVPSFRSIWKNWYAYVSISLAILIFTPHLLWLKDHQWTSMLRAVDSAPADGIHSVFLSIWGFLWGNIAILIVPLFMLWATRDQRLGEPDPGPTSDQTRLIGKILLFSPLVAVILASVVTGQFIKALWLTPLAPSTVAGLALLFPEGSNTTSQRSHDLVRKAVVGSIGITLLYWVYLFAGELIDRPMESYLADTRPLSEAVEALWSKHSPHPLTCVITDESKVGTSPVLWLTSRPDIVDITSTPWATPDLVAKCAATGGIAIVLDGGIPLTSRFPNACLEAAIPVRVGTIFGVASTGWPGSLVYVPPGGSSNCSGGGTE